MKPNVVVPEIPAGLPTQHEEEIARIVPLMKLTKDAKEAAKLLTPAQVRFLVDFYYQMQEHRKAASNQLQSLAVQGEPNVVFDHFAHLLMTTEKQAATLLDIYSESQRLGQWARAIDGIGPIIAAGLLAHVDLTKCLTSGRLWRFAGLDPTNTWYGREKAQELLEKLAIPVHPATEDLLRVAEVSNRSLERITVLATDKNGEITRDELEKGLAKRPWNATLKVLCWKIGKSFVYVSGKPTAFYGHIYVERKAQEEANNDAGKFAEQAARILAEKNYRRDTTARKCYEAGKLPPGHIQARAERYVVKLFLSHYLEVGRRLAGLPIVAPYVIEHMGHVTKIEPPNLPPELE